MRYGQLDKRLFPLPSDDLIRLGRAGDGGYLINLSSLQRADCLVSLGISDDWSFEVDFLRRNPVPLFAFDGSVGWSSFLKKAFRSLGQVTRPRRILRRWRTLVDFFLFFKGDRRFFPYMVGAAAERSHLSFDELIRTHISEKFNRIFVKCDIEGSEYRILPDFIHHADIIEGLVIEFHGVDVFYDRIISFASIFPLDITHVHVNNYPGLSPSGVPYAVELTFTRSRTGSKPVVLPNLLDQANNLNREEIGLNFI